MSKTAAVFNKKKFINEVTETVRHMYRKQLKEASQQEIFQAVSYVVKDVVIDDWLATSRHLTIRIQRLSIICQWNF